MRGAASGSADYDLIVVGAGLAGATAAREARRYSDSVLVLEARDRVAGRTFSDVRNGYEVELGGAFVHWWQGQSFAEVQRYGLELESTPWLAETCCLPGADGPRRLEIFELRRLLLPLTEKFIGDAPEIVERPFEPLAGEIAELDQATVADRIAALQLDEVERTVLSGYLSAMCSGPLDEVGAIGALRWFALHRWDPVQAMDREHFKVRGGVSKLTEAILDDADCELRLESPVAAIGQEDGGVEVTTRAGQRLCARSAILALPVSALDTVELPDAAPEAWRRMAAEGGASKGLKLILRATAESPSLVAVGRPEEPITWLVTDAEAPDGSTMLTGFGPDGDRIDADDLDAVRAAVGRLAPGVEVMEAIAHDWLGDEFAQGTWGLLRPGQLSSLMPELQRPWGRVALAGADLANGWVGFMAGAVESGQRAAQQLRPVLTA